MRRVISGLAMVAWAVLGASPAVAVNILTNPGFETGMLTPWFQGRNFSPDEPEDWNVTSAEAHVGSFSATVVENKEIRQNFTAVPTDDVVEISFWLKQPQNPLVELSFVSVFYDDGSSDGHTFISGDRDQQRWTFFDVTSLLDAGKNLTGFSVFGETGDSPAEQRTFLDDVKIKTRVPEPGTFMLLSVGLTLLAATSVVLRRARDTLDRERPFVTSEYVTGPCFTDQRSDFWQHSSASVGSPLMWKMRRSSNQRLPVFQPPEAVRRDDSRWARRSAPRASAKPPRRSKRPVLGLGPLASAAPDEPNVEELVRVGVLGKDAQGSSARGRRVSGTARAHLGRLRELVSRPRLRTEDTGDAESRYDDVDRLDRLDDERTGVR